MFKKHYSLFLKANVGIQHYQSHGHHYWPDVTREAMIEYWDDSAKHVDNKWNYIYENKIPETQKLIADTLKLSDPSQIVFAPNAHEFVCRLISCFDTKNKISVLTSDSEFYSFDHQINRLSDAGILSTEKISTHPFDNFEERFIDKIKSNSYDMIFLSQVFFNSGMAIKNLKAIVDAVTDPNTMIVVDGYHGFMALPTDLSAVESRVFYMSGAYKYAQGGEGCCFLHIPKASQHRPLCAEWFERTTMDFSALYRLNAVLKLFQRENITVKIIHAHVQKLQKNFREHLLSIDHHYLTEKNILSVDYNHHGHFLTFAMPSPEHAKKLREELHTKNIITDYRSSRLRFGFGLYQNECIDLSAIKH
ncbi:MAG: aminotransferase class V-fold PLP-dependent enzyme [Bacteriovorax sp.]|jgi:selenocysteine lyase/cysteine desulfurase